ncbi:Putative glycoside hydrolase family 18, catalytic domain, glycosyl hydrolase family 18 (GH18) active [Septoria linicola]|uniref:chitinase n=1 Tax=Septoria linicola TaxID=215465 RepID=A0A9Q9B6B3_9PEZI|nr:putative glycoside hydrolase family 18, catalytic domain, glycosyl hydrolase family 18 (GH18) active [Septoria linicola]USW59035.1 Putative glycoside hydrolase family 18, catalytic domain, glycosyl hydrolase family 18 (GH18) active [Septoria linicola]
MAGGVLGADFGSSSNVAAYWGQNSYGQSTGPLAQQNLATYCADTNVDIIPLAFMVQMTGGYNTRSNTTTNAYFASNETSRANQTITKRDAGEQRMVVNFANAGNNCSIFSGTGLLDCGDTIGEDIKTCQEKYGKTILLSVGGATYTEGGFANEDAAIAAAEMVWKTFGPTNDGSTSTNTTTPDQDDIVTTTVIASNGDATTTMTMTFTQGATFGTSVLTTPGATDLPGTAPLVVSSASSILTTSLSVSQDAGTSGEDSATETLTSDTYTGPGLSSAMATSTGNTDMDTNTIPTVNPTDLPGAGPTLGGLSATTSSTNALPGTSEAAPGSTSTVASSSFATVAEVSSRHTRRQAAEILRPFGDAVIDGFDIDLESSTQNFLPFVRRLRELMDANSAKSYFMTAAPQCPYPDAAVSQLLDSDVRFDAVFVQFYNNYCGVQSFTAGAATQTNFNFETWDNWAKNASSRWTTGASNTTTNKRQASSPASVKVFLGVPGGVTGAGSGYVPLEQLGPVVEYSKKFESFGGVMMWDISQAKANDGFLPGVKALLGAAAVPGTTSSALDPATSTGMTMSSSETVASSSASEVLVTSSETLASSSDSTATSTAATELPTSMSETPTSPTDAVAPSTPISSTSTSVSSITDEVASPTDILAPPTPVSPPSSSVDGLTCSCAVEAATVTVTASEPAASSSSVSEAVVTDTASALPTSSGSATDAVASCSDTASELVAPAPTEAPSSVSASELVAPAPTEAPSSVSASELVVPAPTEAPSSASASETTSSVSHSTSDTSAVTSPEVPLPSVLSVSSESSLTSTSETTSLEPSQSFSVVLPSPTSELSSSTASAAPNTDTVSSSVTTELPFSNQLLATSADSMTSTEASSTASEIVSTPTTETLTNEPAEASTTDDLDLNEVPSPSGDLISSIFPTGPDPASPTGAGTSAASSDSTTSSSASSEDAADPAAATPPADRLSSPIPSVPGLSTLEPLVALNTLLPTPPSQTTSVWDLHSATRASSFETLTTTSSSRGLPSPSESESSTSETQSSDTAAPTATPISPTSTDVPPMRSRVVRRKLRMSWRG